MKNFKIIISIAVLFFTACTTNVEPIVYDVPDCLVGSVEVETFINNYAIAGAKMISFSLELSSDASFAKKAKVSMSMPKVAKQIKELKANRHQIEKDLTEEQKKAFDKVVYRIEASIGQKRVDIYAVDESEMAANRALKSEQQTEIDSETAIREEAIAQMKADGTGEEPEASSNEIEMPMFMQILLPIIILGIIIFSIVMGIKKMTGKVKEFGSSMGGVKDKYAEAKAKMKEMEGEGKELSEEQKKAFEFLDKHLDK